MANSGASTAFQPPARSPTVLVEKSSDVGHKKRESRPPDRLPPSRAVFPSSLRAISEVSRYGERGEDRAIKGVPIINSMRCEKITPTWQDTEAAQKIRHLTGS
jgi:hypothetical protein